jgi:hypothetical protein
VKSRFLFASIAVALCVWPAVARAERALLICQPGSLCASWCGTDCSDVLEQVLVRAGADGLDVVDHAASLTGYKLVLFSASDTRSSADEAALVAYANAGHGRIAMLADRDSDTAGTEAYNAVLQGVGLTTRLRTSAGTDGPIRCPAGPGIVASHRLMAGVTTLEYNAYMILQVEPELVLGKSDTGDVILAGTDRVIVSGDATGYLSVACSNNHLLTGGNGAFLANLWKVPFETGSGPDAGPDQPGGDPVDDEAGGCGVASGGNPATLVLCLGLILGLGRRRSRA